MTVWKQATLENFYADETFSDRTHCEVKIANGEIAVSFKDEGRAVVWKGQDIASGGGHFELSGPKGRANLHQSPGSVELVGSWVAEGSEGMCRIELGETDESIR